jgi:hypothetical protein
MSAAKPYAIDKWLVYEAYLFIHWQKKMVGAFA